MKRRWTIAWAVALGVLAGGILETARSRNHWTMPVGSFTESTPAVSSAPVGADAADARVEVRHAADVEIEGERFRIYVGKSGGQEVGFASIWAVAVPAVQD